MLTKRKRVSKKKKISWRKHVNINDVEEFLEDQRLDFRLGKPVSEKTNHELFQVDIKPSTAVEFVSKKLKREALRRKVPKCYSMLRIQKAPELILQRAPISTKYKKPERKTKEIHAKSADTVDAALPIEKDEPNDIWSEKAPNELPASSEWFGKNIQLHTQRGLGKVTRTIPGALRKKTSILPSVEPPHPGISYNPTLTDHMNLMNSVAEKEKKIIKEEEHIRRVTKIMSTKVSPEKRDSDWLSEMSEGLAKQENSDSNDEFEDTEHPHRANKQKTKKQLRKRKENKQKQFELQLQKRNKKKIADIYKLRFINAKLTKDEQRKQQSLAKRLEKKQGAGNETKRLGLIKYEAEEESFNLPGTIAGNLRNIKEEGNLLLNRYKSLQKRNILQPTIARTMKRGKVKRYIKPGYGNNWQVTLAKDKNFTAGSSMNV